MRKEVMRKISNEQFNIKYEMYKNMLYSIAYTYVKNKDDAEDVVQDVFMKYLKSNDVFPTLDNEKFWLIKVVINTAKTHVTRIWKKKVNLNDEYINKVADKKEKRENDLFEVVCKLPSKYKDVIVLFYYEDLSIKEISSALKITEANVKKRLERGRNIIKEKEKNNG